MLAGEATPAAPPRPSHTPTLPSVPPREAGSYARLATASTPALIIYVLDVSASMSQSLGTQRRVDVVREALNAALAQLSALAAAGRLGQCRFQ